MTIQKICPKCGCSEIVAQVTKTCLISISKDTATGKDVFNVLQEDDNPERTKYAHLCCSSCHAQLDIESLGTNTVKCKKCGNEVPASYVNEEGICYTCIAMDSAPDIANASREDLLMMLIKSRMQSETAEPQAEQPAQEPEKQKPEKQEDKKPKNTKKNKAKRESSAKIENEQPKEEVQNPEPQESPEPQMPEPEIGMNPPVEDSQPDGQAMMGSEDMDPFF